MMIDINKELRNILVRNKIIENVSLDGVILDIKNFINNLSDHDVIGIYGVGADADTLLLFLTDVTEDFHIDYCFDRKVKSYSFKNVIKNQNVMEIGHIHEMSVDYMIIGSYLFRDEIRATLKENGYKGIIVDFFELMEPYLKEYTSDYETIYKKRKQFENSYKSSRESALKELIREYLIIRDFDSAFQYIDLYVMFGYTDAYMYEKLKSELQKLLDKIKAHINARQYRDVVIQWIDALPYLHLQNFSFLCSKAEKGVNFENAYTVNPWTTETMKTILFGEYTIEGKLFQRSKFVTDETKLLKLLISKGYRFAYLGMNRYVKLFDNKTIQMPELNFKKGSSSISKQWDALALLCKIDEPLCLLIHTLNETHEPFVCGEIEPYQNFTCTEADWEQDACQKQAQISSRYIDRQFAFYDHLLNDRIIRIYMSDHGRITNSIMRETRVHTVLIVDVPEIEHQAIEGIFSLVYFYDLIECCLNEKKDFTKLVKQYAVVEALDYYNYSWIVATLNDTRYKIEEGLQRRGIITMQDRFCRFANGRECYFVADDDIQDRIDEPKYEKRIEELRKLCGNEFIDINRYDKFKYSKLLYEKIGE